jgi:hypothetical protein
MTGRGGGGGERREEKIMPSLMATLLRWRTHSAWTKRSTYLALLSDSL